MILGDVDGVGVVVGAVALGALHAVGGKLRFISYIPRSGWLSFAGGISVAYVFVHLLPEVSEGASVLSEELEEMAFSERAVWLVALLGLSIFYWVETATRRSRGETRGDRRTRPAVFWVSIGSYALYNALIGYLLNDRARQGTIELTVFVIAIGVHFLVNDFALREHHKHRYRSFGRWILVAAIVLGAVAGAIFEVSEIALASVLGLVAGGVVLNVFKEELPTQAESRFPAFAAGAAGYALVLLAL